VIGFIGGLGGMYHVTYLARSSTPVFWNNSRGFVDTLKSILDGVPVVTHKTTGRVQASRVARCRSNVKGSTSSGYLRSTSFLPLDFTVDGNSTSIKARCLKENNRLILYVLACTIGTDMYQ